LKRWVEEPHNCEICDFGKTRKTIRDKTAQLAMEQYCANGRTAQLQLSLLTLRQMLTLCSRNTT